jgi:hypothetical protein
VTRRVSVVLAGLLLAVQLGAAWPRVAGSLQGARQVHAGLAHPDPAGFAGLPPFAALLDLPPLMAAVPTDARVLLVAGTTVPFAYDFHVLPRPLDVLVRVQERVVARALRLFEDDYVVTRWLDELDARGLRLTPERLAAALDGHDVLVTFLIDEPALGLPPEVAARLQRQDSHGVAVLYRIATP